MHEGAKIHQQILATLFLMNLLIHHSKESCFSRELLSCFPLSLWIYFESEVLVMPIAL